MKGPINPTPERCTKCGILKPSKIIKPCKGCNMCYCDNCLNDNDFCKTCDDKNECKILSEIILAAIDDAIMDKNDMEIKIAMVIAQYSMGYIVNCSNKTQCGNEICIDSNYEFNRPPSIGKYFYYDVEDKYTNQWDKNDIVFVYGKWRRFSCISCPLLRCIQSDCYHKDAVLIFDSCLNHAFCVFCNEISNDNICSICKLYVCDNCECSSFCKRCSVEKEIDDISLAIMKCTDFAIVIIDIITKYSVGIAVKCCTVDCDEEVVTNSKYEFDRLQIDNKIAMYKPKFIGSFKSDEIEYIYGDGVRIFCTECKNINFNLKQCEYLYSDIYDVDEIHDSIFCINMETNNISVCGNHKRCTECDDYGDREFIECIICNKYCCTKMRCNYNNICKTCIILDEFNVKKNCLSLILPFKHNVIDIITTYSMGIGVSCNNKYCDMEIMTNNKFEYLCLYQKLMICHPDIMQNYNDKNMDISGHSLYGEERIIFCNKCSDNYFDNIDDGRYNTKTIMVITYNYNQIKWRYNINKYDEGINDIKNMIKRQDDRCDNIKWYNISKRERKPIKKDKNKNDQHRIDRNKRIDDKRSNKKSMKRLIKRYCQIDDVYGKYKQL